MKASKTIIKSVNQYDIKSNRLIVLRVIMGSTPFYGCLGNTDIGYND